METESPEDIRQREEIARANNWRTQGLAILLIGIAEQAKQRGNKPLAKAMVSAAYQLRRTLPPDMAKLTKDCLR